MLAKFWNDLFGRIEEKINALVVQYASDDNQEDSSEW